MKRKNSTGFTLLEVMVVVVILGILATIIVPNIFGRLHHAKVQVAHTNLQAIESALQMFRLDHNRVPTTDEGLMALQTNPGSVKNYPPEGYLKLPKDPWGNRYSYIHPGRDSLFDLYSRGADGQPGGDGVNADISNHPE